MVRYETLILSIPEITADETSALENEFERLVKKSGGSITSFERWGKYRLAYPVQNNEYGVYFLTRFETNLNNVDELTKDIHSLFTVKYPQMIMRFMNSRLDMDQSLTYYKPESLEDIPSQDVDTFLRENKMEGLLKTTGTLEAPMPKVAKSVEEDDENDADLEETEE
ncbi:MAG: 30S ribosomal protein S6 [Candidatus Babeliales bacterium]